MAAVTPTPSLEWTLLFNVFFGSIASRAFSEFYQSVFGDLDRDQGIDAAGPSASTAAMTWPHQRYYGLRTLVFVSAFAFYIYDWIVLQLLYVRYPYSVTNSLSYFRFANDLVMAFCLFSIVSTAAKPRVLERPLRLLVFVSVWHVLAAFWHILAQREYTSHVTVDSSLIWHLLVVQALYWLTYLVFRFVILRYRLKRTANVEATTRSNVHWTLATESLIILMVSTVRTFVVLSST